MRRVITLFFRKKDVADESGFTLLEVVVGVALAVGIMLSVINLISIYMGNSLKVNRQNSTIEDINSTLYAITNDIRHACRANSDDHLRILDAGRKLVLYRAGPGSRMLRITYNREDNGDFVREIAESINESSPYNFPVSNQSRTLILSNVDDAEIFIDNSDSGVDPMIRLIEVRFAVKDKNNNYEEESSMRVMSRVREGGVE